MLPEPGALGSRPDDAPLAEDILPLVEERLVVGKRQVESGRVRISLTTEAVAETVRETLRGRHAEVERIPFGHEVTQAPQTRQEGDVLIVPVVEEILVIEKRLVLKEEIHLRFIDSETVVEQAVERRVQHAKVERLQPDGNDPPDSGSRSADQTRGQEP